VDDDRLAAIERRIAKLESFASELEWCVWTAGAGVVIWIVWGWFA
jgi:hypothetical protein